MLSISLSSSSISTPPLHENAILKEAFNNTKVSIVNGLRGIECLRSTIIKKNENIKIFIYLFF
jgi:hypothetical protein